MSERKVLNKYYPPDYDPSNIPRANRPKNRQWTIRTMAPFNMRCNTCGEYIYKGKKFNSRQELADGETYLGLKIFRFYIKCPRCVSEISFKTDPENVDYQMEAGATRNFEALRTAELMAEREAKEKEAELENNPMKMLENRTKASQREMDMLETLEDLRDMNSKHAKVDTEDIILKYRLYEEKLQQLQDEEDEKFVESLFGKSGEMVVKRIKDDSGDDSDDSKPAPSKVARRDKPTDFLTQESTSKNEQKSCSTTGKTSTKKSGSAVKKSVGLLSSSKSALGMLVKKKQPTKSATTSSNSIDDKKNDNIGKSEQTLASCDKNQKSTINSSKDNEQVKSQSCSIKKDDVKELESKNNTVVTAPTSIGATVGSSGGLSLVGNYSASDSDEESD